jgi:hypothetical protein
VNYAACYDKKKLTLYCIGSVWEKTEVIANITVKILDAINTFVRVNSLFYNYKNGNLLVS